MSNGWSISSKIVAWIFLISGVVTGIVVAASTETWWLFFAITPSAVIMFILFGTLGYIAENLNTSSLPPAQDWMANVAQKRAEESAPKPGPARLLSDGKWSCTCGRVNQSYTTTCPCGLNKHDVLKNFMPASSVSETTEAVNLKEAYAKHDAPAQGPELKPGMVKCANCDTIQNGDRKVCYFCGADLSNGTRG